MVFGVNIRIGQKIVDVLRDSGMAWVICEHGKVWPEGDTYEEEGGKACMACCLESK